MKQIDLRSKFNTEINSLVHGAVNHFEGNSNKGDLSHVWECEEGNKFESFYIGNIFCVMPSGKYYVGGLTTNQTWRDVVKDSFFMEMFEEKLDKLNMWIHSGAGSATDLFITRHRSDLEG